MNVLVEKGWFALYAIFTNVKTICVTFVAIIKSQKIQLEKKSNV